MAKKKKRITRKELLKEPDEFLTYSAKAIRFVQENQKQVSYVLIGAVVVILAFFVFRYFSHVSEWKAYALFEEGLIYYIGQNLKEGSASFNEIGKAKFDEVLKNYSSTNAARLSLPLYADMHFKTDSYDKAIEFYRQALEGFEGEQSIQAIIWNGLGYAYEGKKDFQSALECFQKVLGFQGNFLKGNAYFNVGRMHELMNNRDKALEAFDRVANDYADSVHGKLAKEKASQLRG